MFSRERHNMGDASAEGARDAVTEQLERETAALLGLLDAAQSNAQEIHKVLRERAERIDAEAARRLREGAADAARAFFAEEREASDAPQQATFLQAVRWWWYYATSYTRGMPPEGKPDDADAVIVQAFGRNHIADSDLFVVGALRAASKSDVAAIEKIAASGFDPGAPNAALAQEMRALMERYNIPALAQWEVAVAAFLKDEDWVRAQGDVLVSIWPPEEPQVRFNTADVTKEAARVMHVRRLSAPIEVASAAMVARAFMTVKDIFTAPPVVVEQGPVVWDKESTQYQIRGPVTWIPREILARVYFAITRGA